MRTILVAGKPQQFITFNELEYEKRVRLLNGLGRYHLRKMENGTDPLRYEGQNEDQTARFHDAAKCITANGHVR